MASASDRIEAAIEKLTSISSDLKSMIAVHDQRIGQQEKNTETINIYLEKRREEMDTKLKDVYDTMRSQDNNVLEEIAKLRKESSDQHNILSNKINQLEKYIWVAIGGGTMFTWAFFYIGNYFIKMAH